MEKTDKDNSLQVELSDEVAQGIYANFSTIAHSSSEFVIDYLRLMPRASKAKVQSRIIMAPEQAKRFMLALQDNIKKYEMKFGPIQLYNESPTLPIPPVKGEA